jgi:serine/threonine-protein kinase
MGTPYYMAPEQARGARDVDHRADVYAAGVILFEMLAGRRPFDAANYNELIVRVATTEPVPLLALRPGLDATLAGVVRRAMDRDPARRFQSMAELARALEPIAGRPPGPRPGEAMAAPAAPAEIGVAPTMPPPAAAGAAPPPPRTAIASAQPATTRALPKTVDSGAPRGRGRGRWALAAGLVAALGAAAGFAVLHSGPGDGPGDDGRTAAPLPVSEPAAAKAPASQPPDDDVRLEAPPSPLGPEPPRPPASLAPEDVALVGPGNASKLGNACFLHFRAGRYEPGRAACYRGLDLDASDNVRGALYYNLCMIEHNEGRIEQARWYCRKSLEVRPGNEAVIKRLAVLTPPPG